MENQCGLEVNVLQNFYEDQQEFERILQVARKQIQTNSTFIDFRQLNEFLSNFHFEFDRFDEMKISVEIFDRSTQFELLENVRQSENSWTNLLEQVEKKRTEIGKKKRKKNFRKEKKNFFLRKFSIKMFEIRRKLSRRTEKLVRFR